MLDGTQTLFTDLAIVKSVNLSLTKSIEICSDEAAPGLIDGNRQQLVETIESLTCPEKVIEIDFGGIFYFHAVIVYGGEQLVNGRLESDNIWSYLCE